MEHGGAQNGVPARSNHERDLKVANGINGATTKRDPSPNKVTKTGGLAPTMGNGDTEGQKTAQAGAGASDQSITNTLPPEITHITENLFPLHFILQRLAQKSHNELQLKIEELANVPMGPGAVHGSAAGAGDDSSEANQNKKANLLNFVNDMHGKWVKALVLSEWSRKSRQVSKVIDLHGHIFLELRKYDYLLDRVGHIKRNLYNTRLPDPDLKTALQVLSTGQTPWMPDHLNLVPPPPLSSQEIIKWINELNVLLSIRLNLEDYDRIPPQFKDYSIDDGRVTFKVRGEFELDLTIADDDFDKQWWFLDFRFTFSPAPQELTDRLRFFVEQKVNEVLEKEGLKACYEFLHEFVMTHKINELRRQAVALSRGLWIDNLRIESLNRAISIQYWTNRLAGRGGGRNSLAPNTSKSWVIIGVNSGKTPAPNAPFGAPSTSYLTLRWFRDGKEVSDEGLSLNTDNISAERLMKRIISLHIKHILTSIHAKLLSKPRYANRQASVTLDLSQDDPSESSLAVQITHSETLTVRINAITGFFFLGPVKTYISREESQLNFRSRDSVEDGFTEIESIRRMCTFDEIARRSRGVGWILRRPPVEPDETKILHPSKEPYQDLWIKIVDWPRAWFVAVSLSLAGDAWWLVEIVDDGEASIQKRMDSLTGSVRPRQQSARNGGVLDQPSRRINSHKLLPIKPNPEFTDEFFTDLATLASDAMISAKDDGELSSRKIRFVCRSAPNPHISPRLKMPALYIKTAGILQQVPDGQTGSQNTKQSLKTSWARDFVQLQTRGIFKQNARFGRIPQLSVVREAKVIVKDKSKLALIKKGSIGQGVSFDPRIGQFTIILHGQCDRSCIPRLVARLKAIDKLVDFVTTINDPTGRVKCDSATLRKLVFTYGDANNDDDDDSSSSDGRYKVTLEINKGENSLIFGSSSPHIRVLDMMNKLVNSDIGFRNLPNCLQTTLAVYRAFDAIEDSWENLSKHGQGFVEIIPHAIDYITVHFELPNPPGAVRKTLRRLRVAVRARVKNDKLWWQVVPYVVDENLRSTNAHSGGDGSKDNADQLHAALDTILNSRASPEGWTGLGRSGVAGATAGIEPLLMRINQIAKAVATGVPPPQPPSAPSGNIGASQGFAIVLD